MLDVVFSFLFFRIIELEVIVVCVDASLVHLVNLSGLVIVPVISCFGASGVSSENFLGAVLTLGEQELVLFNFRVAINCLILHIVN